MKKEINFMLVPSGESELLFDKPRYDSKDRRRGKSEQTKESDKGKKEDEANKDYKNKVKEDKEIKDIPKDKREKVKPEDKEEKISPKEKKEKVKPKDKKEEIELKEKEVSEKIKDILEKVKPETNVIDIQIIREEQEKPKDVKYDRRGRPIIEEPPKFRRLRVNKQNITLELIGTTKEKEEVKPEVKVTRRDKTPKEKEKIKTITKDKTPEELIFKLFIYLNFSFYFL